MSSDSAQHVTTEAHDAPSSDLATDPGTGGDILVEVMRSAGVEVAFGVISIHNLPLIEAVDRDLRFVPVRHEAAAVNAADGYARATGGIGVAITSTGTGAGNAAGSMLEAMTAQSRVLHVTGNIDSDLIGEHSGAYHEVPRQLDMLSAVSGHALRIGTARQPRAVLTEAVRLLRSAPHLPVSVDWPIDLQYTADPAEQNKVGKSEPVIRPTAKRDLERFATAMRAARRPLIWAGGGAREASADVVRLAETWQAGVLTGTNGRGSIAEDHPLCVGNFAGADELADLIGAADCLLTLGSHLRAHETRNGEVPLPRQHLQIDLDAEALGRNYPITEGLQTDLRAALPGLTELLEGGPTATEPDWPAQVAEAARNARAAHRADIGAYAKICRSMRRRLPRRAPIVRDVTIPSSSWGNRLLAVHDPRDNIYAAGGGIGQGLAMAIGAAVGRPDQPVLGLVGDGGLAVHLGELAVLAAERPRVVLVVFNDRGYGVLRNMQTEKDSDRRGVDLTTPKFDTLAKAFGLRHRRVGDPKDFDTVLKKALAKDGPTIIEVMVDDLRPRPAPFVPPVQVP